MTPSRVGVADTELVALLELLHPGGPGRSAHVVGSGPPPSGGADIVLVEPSFGDCLGASGRRFADSVRAAATTGALVALRAPAFRRWWCSRRLRSAGFRAEGAFLVRPPRRRARLLVPAGGDAAAYAANRLRPARRSWQRLAAAALRSQTGGLAASLAGPTLSIVAELSASTTLEWLSFAGRAPRRREVVAFRGDGGDRRLLVFEHGVSEPMASVLVRMAAEHASAATREAPASAATAGAAVPRALGRRTLGLHDVSVETAVAGAPAVAVLASRPRALLPTLDLVAAWLERWNLASARAVLDPYDLLERELLGPARELDASYCDAVAPLAEKLEAAGACEVETHGDLTMWNVLVDVERGGLGVVDWETSRSGGLPLVDLLYAAVDARAAVDSYRDRLGAFKNCFTADGDVAGAVEAWVQRLAHVLSLTPEFVVVAFHACWLNHARNEAAQGATDEQPFRRIVDWLLTDGTRLGQWARP